MEWTPEAVKAQMDYRIEDARRHHVASQLRKARTRHASPPLRNFWRLLRSSGPSG